MTDKMKKLHEKIVGFQSKNFIAGAQLAIVYDMINYNKADNGIAAAGLSINLQYGENKW